MGPHIALINDSFYPTVDGVSVVVSNYAKYLMKKNCKVTVITPNVKGADYDYDYEVLRYSSVPISRNEEYMLGLPFNRNFIKEIKSKDFDLLHVHCPIVSSYVAEKIKKESDIPVILTYHAKFDYDAKRFPTKPVQNLFLKMIRNNINKADEVWAVSPGAYDNLKGLGFEGDYRIMPNGVDFPKGKASTDEINKINVEHDLKDNELVFLYVGRLMWYKNIKVILDALKILKENGQKFKFIMVGNGPDKNAIIRYISNLKLTDDVILTGKIDSREKLRAYYSRADAFLFPSDFDTCGLVVHEAAACECPCVLIKNSSASYGVDHLYNGYLADSDNPQVYYETIVKMLEDRELMKIVSENASNTLYLPWEDAVNKAYRTYTEIFNGNN